MLSTEAYSENKKDSLHSSLGFAYLVHFPKMKAMDYASKNISTKVKKQTKDRPD